LSDPTNFISSLQGVEANVRDWEDECREESILKKSLSITRHNIAGNTWARPQREVYLGVVFGIPGMQGYGLQFQLTIHIHSWDNIPANEEHRLRKLPFSTWMSISTFHLTTVEEKITL
jgi:hypothetical protein